MNASSFLSSSPSSHQKFSRIFLEQLQKSPQARVAAIIRVTALSPEIEREVEDAGCLVTRRLRLVPSLAVEGPASALLRLAESDWVQRIEPDQAVHTL